MIESINLKIPKGQSELILNRNRQQYMAKDQKGRT